MKKIIKDKHGDIPIVVLVIGVFLVCTMAVGSFYLFGNKIKANSVGIRLIERANADADKYYFYENIGKTDEEIENILKIQRDEEGNKYIYLEEKSAKGFLEVFRKEKIILSVKYYLP